MQTLSRSINEPPLEEIIGDPLTHHVMQSSGVTEQQLRDLCDTARSQIRRRRETSPGGRAL
jgi:hypothetical protein